MPTRVVMPKLGESVTEGSVTRWLKQPGERVEKLEPLLEVSTDKIDTEIPSPASGILLKILVAEGSTVDVGTLLALIGESTEADVDDDPTSSAHERSPESVAAPPAPKGKSDEERPTSVERPAGRDFVSPVVKRLVAEHDVDLAQLEGSGLAGRVTKQDVLAFLVEQGIPSVAADAGSAPDEILHPLTAMRRAIAQHMVRSVQTAPHATTIFEVEMTAVLRHREQHRADAAARGVALTITPYIVEAVAKALRLYPVINSRYTEAGIVENRRVHVGVAVAVEGGLLVPVVRDADDLTLHGLSREIGELAQRAREGSLAPDALSGGTFTVTNYGVSGSLLGTPIIAQPQGAILGVGAIVKRPVVVTLPGSGRPSLLPGSDDLIAIRPMAFLSLTFDHRLLDGAMADAFLGAVKQRLEGWRA